MPMAAASPPRPAPTIATWRIGFGIFLNGEKGAKRSNGLDFKAAIWKNVSGKRWCGKSSFKNDISLRNTTSEMLLGKQGGMQKQATASKGCVRMYRRIRESTKRVCWSCLQGDGETQRDPAGLQRNCTSSIVRNTAPRSGQQLITLLVMLTP